MTFVDPYTVHNPATGTAAPASWGDTVAGDLNFLATDKPGCRVFNSADINIAVSTWTALTFDSEKYDNQSMHSTATNTSRITVPFTAVYSVGGSVNWQLAGLSADVIYDLAIRVNGSQTLTLVETSTQMSASALGCRQQVATDYRISAGDYLELWVRHDVGVAINVLATQRNSPHFYCNLISL